MISKYRNSHTFTIGHESCRPWLGKHRSQETKDKISSKLKGIHLSEETKIKMHLAKTGRPQLWPHHAWNKGQVFSDIRGDKHWNWQGGKSYKADPRKTLCRLTEYKNWRQSVFERDNYTCQLCGLTGVQLNADHIKPWSTHPDLRYEISNGRTLCINCHLGTPTWGKKAINQ